MSAVVINLIGGPGCGKSTTAAGLFFMMKISGFKCELVTEFPKELVYDEDWLTLKNQLFVLAEQERRQRRLVDKVNFIITDAPLLTMSTYATDPRDKVAVSAAAKTMWDTYDNVNFAMIRVKPYMRYGRTQSEQEARAKDYTLINDVYKDEVIEAFIAGDEKAPAHIMNQLRALGLV